MQLILVAYKTSAHGSQASTLWIENEEGLKI